MCVVIPTYNEKENLAPLVEVLRSLAPDLSIIVIDDNSPDGTGALADRLAQGDVSLRVIHRSRKSGRGSACLEGFAAALENPEIAAIVEMDADFSHDPRELPGMLDALARADVVIGSRYTPQSAIVDWGFSRRILSRYANVIARAALGIPLTDYTNGYRAYARRAVAALDFSRIESSGYIVLSEVAYQLYLEGFRFEERPTTFVNRRRGESNLTWRELLGAFVGLVRLCLRYRGARPKANR